MTLQRIGLVTDLCASIPGFLGFCARIRPYMKVFDPLFSGTIAALWGENVCKWAELPNQEVGLCMTFAGIGPGVLEDGK